MFRPCLRRLGLASYCIFFHNFLLLMVKASDGGVDCTFVGKIVIADRRYASFYVVFFCGGGNSCQKVDAPTNVSRSRTFTTA